MLVAVGEVEGWWVTLQASRCLPEAVPAIAQPGVYALFLRSGTALPHVVLRSDGLLYIGMTETSLAARNHLTHKASGFSSLRRSLGALLKAELALIAIPRSPGSSDQYYSFAPEGEARLTEWMLAHLTYGFVVIDQDTRQAEKLLIGSYKPPLNLTHWKNPEAADIKARRRMCREEAKAGSQS